MRLLSLAFSHGARNPTRTPPQPLRPGRPFHPHAGAAEIASRAWELVRLRHRDGNHSGSRSAGHWKLDLLKSNFRLAPASISLSFCRNRDSIALHVRAQEIPAAASLPDTLA